MCHVDVLYISVHAADTLALLHIEKDEAVVSPPGAPRVLDLPVAIVTGGILQTTSGGILVVVPPLIDEVAWADRCVVATVTAVTTITVWVDSVVICGVGVANDYHGVVKSIRVAL